ncbi:alpha/beta fold hydrolase [Streptomyces radicis]|uniref:Alpha/beta fold hydrolase n=1 Tax=Streptomyces radicis TaxID=1750517 RepID=A0A3A9WDT6_9ACTN|nr:alpha/beta fold hydrolase [Streptomyces radicis]RKN10930.1 alpha/beta fold hydrolase [Streptomyces radicis]RKN25193.1 alpha/beta fold hydrolase [Streptomyces radicis]
MKNLPPQARSALSALLGPVPLTRSQALGASERLAAATTLVGSLEYLANRRHTGPRGLNDWAVAREAFAARGRPLRRALDTAAHPWSTRALHAARVATAAGLMLPGGGRWRGAADLFLGASNSLLYPTQRYGTDGSDQASGLVQVATGLARLSGSPQAQDALLWYIALQSNLSYLVSGWVKLLGADWRDGSALGGVLRTRTYGERHLWRLTQRYPRAARTVAHGVLALECLFPVLYARGGRLARPVLASAASFHVANGFVMGLGRFVTSFTAMHPAVAYTSTPRSHPAVAGRDDRMLPVAGLLAAGGTVAAGAVAAARRLRVTDAGPGTGTVTTRHGNVLRFRGTPGAGDGDPVLVFVHGLAATPMHFGWYAQAFSESAGAGAGGGAGEGGGAGWLTYHRAGYGPSRRVARGAYTLRESVDDLVDLVDGALPEGRPVVLVGHSLGGEIARRAAHRLGERLRGVVYLDASHPDELNRSSQQGSGAAYVGGALRTFGVSLRAGMGILLSRPSWVDNLPAAVRRPAMAAYADARMWRAATREWRSTEIEFRAHEGPLRPQDSNALVVSAQHTVDRDPDQLLMHQEIADAHRRPGRVVRSVVVEGADHDGLLTEPRLAAEVVGHIRGFLAESNAVAAHDAPVNAAAPTAGPLPFAIETESR